MYEAMKGQYESASITSANCVRLCQLLGLDRLDSINHWELQSPPAVIFDVEEGRRVFWAAFTLDCHAFFFGGTTPLLCTAKVGEPVLCFSSR